MGTKTISFCQGKGSLSHNNREFSAKNVDSTRTKDNVVFEQKSIEQAYDECFGAAVERYNDKQKRSDRKIKDGYFQYAFNRKPCDTVVVASDKRKSFYEDIVYIGTKDNTGIGSPDAAVAAECLTEYMNGFQGRNPNFHVFNAVLHMDEATPHLHIDYIPLGHYKRGVDTQNGIAQALKEMGFGEGKDAISRWRESERKVITEICNKHGIEISAPEKSRGSFEVEEYKKYKDTISDLKQQAQSAEIKRNSAIERVKEAEKAANAADEKLAKLSEELTEKELSQIDTTPKKFTGGFKGLTPEEAQKLKNTAEKNIELKKKIEDLEKENLSLNKRINVLNSMEMKYDKEISEIAVIMSMLSYRVLHRAFSGVTSTFVKALSNPAFGLSVKNREQFACPSVSIIRTLFSCASS